MAKVDYQTKHHPLGAHGSSDGMLHNYYNRPNYASRKITQKETCIEQKSSTILSCETNGKE